jgi:hypothetical protein
LRSLSCGLPGGPAVARAGERSLANPWATSRAFDCASPRCVRLCESGTRRRLARCRTCLVGVGLPNARRGRGKLPGKTHLDLVPTLLTAAVTPDPEPAPPIWFRMVVSSCGQRFADSFQHSRAPQQSRVVVSQAARTHRVVALDYHQKRNQHGPRMPGHYQGVETTHTSNRTTAVRKHTANTLPRFDAARATPGPLPRKAPQKLGSFSQLPSADGL